MRESSASAVLEPIYTDRWLGWALARTRPATLAAHAVDDRTLRCDNGAVQAAVLRALAAAAAEHGDRPVRTAPDGRAHGSWEGLTSRSPDNLVTDADDVAKLVIEVKSRWAQVNAASIGALRSSSHETDRWRDPTAGEVWGAFERVATSAPAEEWLSPHGGDPLACGCSSITGYWTRRAHGLHEPWLHQADVYRASRRWLPRAVGAPESGDGLDWIVLLPSARQARAFAHTLLTRDSWMPVDFRSFVDRLAEQRDGMPREDEEFFDAFLAVTRAFCDYDGERSNADRDAFGAAWHEAPVRPE
ncbi:MAG: hypothetical protein J7480_07445 [Microbacteriaceae bacterium]|nr:hypothetical protein [Microbacteriaceae bacterium]